MTRYMGNGNIRICTDNYDNKYNSKYHHTLCNITPPVLHADCNLKTTLLYKTDRTTNNTLDNTLDCSEVT